MANVKTLVYQLWPLSWGSIRMMTAFLPKIAALGVDYVWLSPIYQSPCRNHGYDVSDYYFVNDKLGTMKDLDEFVSVAHMLGLKVIMDLIIDSTSIDHNWYRTEPSRYSQNTNYSWDLDEPRYCSYFNRIGQADLEWFQNGILNRVLVREFKHIMEFWLYQHDIDGFRLDSVQSLNRDTNSKDDVRLGDLMIGKRAVTAINELSSLYGKKMPFLMMDCVDLEFGKAVDFYAENTDVEFITNKVLKSTIAKKATGPSRKSVEELCKKIHHHAMNPRFMLDLESHDAPRFTSRSGMEGKRVLEMMFKTKVHAICLYQGQELGLENPTSEELPLSEMINLDAKVAIQLKKQASLESLRQNSRANARVSIPLDEYTRQEQDSDSVLNYAKYLIRKWKNS